MKSIEFGALWSRLPAITVALISCALYLFQPLEISDVLYDIDGTFAYVATRILPPLLILAAHHISYIANRASYHPIFDGALLSIPVIAVAMMFSKASGELQWPLLLLALAFFALTLALARGLALLGKWALPATYGLVAVCYAGLLVTTLNDPVVFARALGSLSILIIAIGLFSVLLGALLYKPRIGLVLAAFFLLVFFLDGSSHDLEFVPSQRVADMESPTFARALGEWLEARQDIQAYRDARRPYPVFIVTAEGGGIYAASHAYLLLSRMSQICPNFAQHVFLAVGVSGGSLGVGLYRAAWTEKQQIQGLQDCRPLAKPDENAAASRRELFGDETPVLSDHLAPALAAFLFVESLDSIIPGRLFAMDRGIALERSFEQSDGDAGTTFAQNYLDHWAPTTAAPALVFVATDVKTGNRLSFSPFHPYQHFAFDDESAWYTDPIEGMDLRISSAISASARFPWLTPTAAIRYPSGHRIVLADGGYFENSGIDTAMEILTNIQVEASRGGSECGLVLADSSAAESLWEGCDKHARMTLLTIGISNRSELPDIRQSFLFDPISTMLSTRSARGRLALHHAQRQLCGLNPCHYMGMTSDDKIFEHQAPLDLLQMPLSWKMSRERMGRLSAQIGATEECAALKDPDGAGERLPFTGLAKPRETSHNQTEPQPAEVQKALADDRARAGCMLAIIAGLFNPTDAEGRYGLSYISTHDADE